MRTLTLALLAVSSVSIADAQLVLPWSGTDPTATLSSFQIIKSGSSGRANTLYITSATNDSDALLVNTVGGGRAGYFQLNNPSSSNQTVRADSNGIGASVFGYMTGTGRAGSFRVSNVANSSNALYALTSGTGYALKAEGPYQGRAAEFIGHVEMRGGGNADGLTVDNGGGIGVRGVGSTGLIGTGSAQGIFASSPSNSGTGIAASTYGTASMAVWAFNGAGTGTTYAGFFQNKSTTGTGIVGYCDAPSGPTYGLKGNVVSPDGYALYAVGRFTATGTKAFQIDHPLNPENEVLNHYCSEAPEPVNFYEGNTVSDVRGYAVIVLPDYFDSINIDPKYSLTVIDDSDDFVLVKVTKEIKNNQFTIRTSKPRVKVSWRVDAIRNDRWVQKYGYQAEQLKTQEQRNKYIQPELYNQPPHKGIHYLLPTEKATSIEYTVKKIALKR